MWRATSLLLVCLLSIHAGANQQGDNSAKDLQALQGDWKLTAGQHAGQILPPTVVASFTMSVKDKLYEFRTNEETERGTITLDASRKPAQIDILISDGSYKGQKQLGIYELTGNKVKFCVTLPDDRKRPEKFESTAANKCMIFEFEQVKK